MELPPPSECTGGSNCTDCSGTGAYGWSEIWVDGPYATEAEATAAIVSTPETVSCYENCECPITLYCQADLLFSCYGDGWVQENPGSHMQWAEACTPTSWGACDVSDPGACTNSITTCGPAIQGVPSMIGTYCLETAPVPAEPDCGGVELPWCCQGPHCCSFAYALQPAGDGYWDMLPHSGDPPWDQCSRADEEGNCPPSMSDWDMTDPCFPQWIGYSLSSCIDSDVGCSDGPGPPAEPPVPPECDFHTQPNCYETWRVDCDGGAWGTPYLYDSGTTWEPET
jgi:hypothetical protein